MSKVISIAGRPSSKPGTPRSPLKGNAIPHGTVSRNGKFRWSAGWGQWVPTGREEEQIPLPGPLESGPLLPERHSASCLCVDCWNAGVRYGDYLKAKAIRERNGF